MLLPRLPPLSHMHNVHPLTKWKWHTHTQFEIDRARERKQSTISNDKRNDDSSGGGKKVLASRKRFTQKLILMCSFLVYDDCTKFYIEMVLSKWVPVRGIFIHKRTANPVVGWLIQKQNKRKQTWMENSIFRLIFPPNTNAEENAKIQSIESKKKLNALSLERERERESENVIIF